MSRRVRAVAHIEAKPSNWRQHLDRRHACLGVEVAEGMRDDRPEQSSRSTSLSPTTTAMPLMYAQ
jgi:hypothetical protein